MTPRHYATKGQRGVALVISLVFLTVLATLGISLARNSTLEERMAANTRDRDLAFQAAEAALQAAETDLPGFLTNPFDGSTHGLTAYDTNPANSAYANDAAYWNSLAWDNSDSQEADVALAHVEAKPRYIIEKKPNTSVEMPPGSGTTVTVQHFRVTVRGLGATAETAVILQAEYDYY